MSPTPPAPDPRLSAPDIASPWLGLASFTEESRALFHGRDDEIANLARRVRRRPLTVLFGQSGLGKTSLIAAGLAPMLRAEGFLPVSLRLRYEEGAPTPADQIKQAVFRASASAGTWTRPGAARDGDGHLGATQSAESLWEFFHHRDDVLQDAAGRALVPLLVFDQFEEIFTVAQADDAGRARAHDLCADLADLVENRAPLALEQDETAGERFDFARADYRVLIAVREDYLANLEGLAAQMPSITQNRVRLTRLTGAQALEAVLRPGAGLVSDDVARAIVRFVAGGAEIERAEVEPSLLSLVCRELNEERLARGAAVISADLLAGSRDTILSEFYERAIGDQPAAVREFIEDHLLTDSGFRESVAEERVRRVFSDGGAPGALSALVDRRLLRIEERLDVRRVELAHDVLCRIVGASRETRHAREAKATAERQLAESQAREHATRRALWRARLVATGAVALAALAIASAVFGWVNLRRARMANARTEIARGQAEQLAHFVMTDLQPGLIDRGASNLLRASTEVALRYFESLPGDMRTLATDRAHADALESMAKIHMDSLVDSPSAELWDRAHALRQQVAAAQPTDPNIAVELVRNEYNRDSALAITSARYDPERCKRRVQVWRTLATRFPDSPLVRMHLADALADFSNDTANAWSGMHLPRDSYAAAFEAYTLINRVCAEGFSHRSLSNVRLHCMLILAQARQNTGETVESLLLCEQARDQAEAASRADPGNFQLRSDLAEVIWSQAQFVELSSLERAVPIERDARERFALLQQFDPNSRGYAFTFAAARVAEVHHLAWVDCRIEAAREAFRAWDAMLEPVCPYRSGYVRRLLWQNSTYRSCLASSAGDESDARACAERTSALFDEYLSEMPEDPLTRRLARIDYDLYISRAYVGLRDWPILESTARRCLDATAAGLRDSPDQPDLQLSSLLATGFLGLALWNEGTAPEARDALESAHRGLRERTFTPRFRDVAVWVSRLVTRDLAKLEAADNNSIRARALLDALVVDLQKPHEPIGISWLDRELLAEVCVQLAQLPPASGALRDDELLDRAWAILDSPEAVGRITVRGKEAKAMIEALRTTASTPR